MVISMIETVSPGFDVVRPFGFECAQRGAREVEVHVRDRAEAAALDQHWLLVEHFRRLQHFAVGGEHRRAGQAELHEIAGSSRDCRCGRSSAPENSIRSISMRSVVRPSSSDSSSLPGSVAEEARAVHQVHADDAERFLLQRRSRHRACARG